MPTVTVHASRVAPCPPASTKEIGSYVRTHASSNSGWQNSSMAEQTPEGFDESVEYPPCQCGTCPECTLRAENDLDQAENLNIVRAMCGDCPECKGKDCCSTGWPTCDTCVVLGNEQNFRNVGHCYKCAVAAGKLYGPDFVNGVCPYCGWK